MNHLVPEKRFDKNGVLATKHVRAYNAAVASLGKFPKPVVSKSEFVIADGTAPVMEIVELRITRLPEETSDEEIRNVLATLHGQTPVILDRARIGAQTINSAVEASLSEKNFALMNNMAVLGDLAVGENKNEFDKYVGGLHYYHHLWGRIDLTESDEAQVESARALVQSALDLRGLGYSSHFGSRPSIAIAFYSDPLVTLIASRPKEAGRITSLIKERGLSIDTDEDIVHIVDLLESSVGPLDEGAL